MTTLLVATRNSHKTDEIRAVLGKKFRCVSLTDFPSAPPVTEDGNSFEENAQKKAISIAVWLAKSPKIWADVLKDAGKLYVLADDSGLEVDALQGAPGIHSARFAASDSATSGNSPDAANNAKL